MPMIGKMLAQNMPHYIVQRGHNKKPYIRKQFTFLSKLYVMK
jgi:hypothetical protein